MTMEALTGFAVLSLLSSLLLSLLPETRLKSTVHLVASLLLLLSWLTALQTLCTRFSQPESSATGIAAAARRNVLRLIVHSSFLSEKECS
jgi:hypothetical protein